MQGKMKVAVMNGIGQMGFIERDIPTPGPDEVLVKLEYVGICGSDMHYYETGAIGKYVVKPPFVLGHEPGGRVVEVGENVRHLKVGDRVALEPVKPADIVNSAARANITSVPTSFSLQHLLLTVSFKNMSPMKRRSALNCRIMSAQWKAL